MTNVIFTYLGELVYKTGMGSSSILKTVSFQDVFKHLMNETDFLQLNDDLPKVKLAWEAY